MLSDPSVLLLMYFVLPLWLAVGFADWLCHRATRIEATTGAKESLIHLLMFGEMAIPLLAVMFFEVNALVILVMIIAFVVHELTAIWDVRYATTARTVAPVEQHVHSGLEMIPLMALLIVLARHWDQFLALFGLGAEAARFDLQAKAEPVPFGYVVSILAAILVFELLPYFEELWRCLRENAGALVPAKARRGSPGQTTLR